MSITKGDYVKRLPDTYNKAADSNNNKLLQINETATTALKKDIQDIYDVLDLNKAYGKTLDLYGEMVNQPRGAMNDTKYRYLIFAKIGSNLAGGDYNSTMSHLVQMFNCGLDDVKLEDMEIHEENTEPCRVKLAKFPVWVLANAGFTSRQAVQMIEPLLPICVTIEADEFEGTFEFADADNIYDEDAGFADDSQTIGGHFGMLLGEDGDTPLPII